MELDLVVRKGKNACRKMSLKFFSDVGSSCTWPQNLKKNQNCHYK